jgi:uncharacterized protein (TIGR03089 family)
MPSATTFPALLAAQLRLDPGRPLVTFYDDATGERVELSVTTYANWVAKTATLVQDELGLERGGRIRIELPTHWLGPVWLGAAWAVGLVVTTGDAELVVCGPDTLAGPTSRAQQVVAVSLRPLGGRFAEPLPAGVVDYGEVVLAQPDAFLPDEPPEPDDPAWADDQETLTHRDLVALDPETSRLLTDVNPCTRAGLVTFLGPLSGGAGTVWVRNPDPASWRHKADTERARVFVI